MDPSMMDPAAMEAMMMDPAMAMGMAPPGQDPALGMGGMAPMPGAPQYPSTDPNTLSQILGLLGELRSADQMALQSQQDSVLMELLSQLGVGGLAPDAGFAEGGMPMGPPPMDPGMAY